MAQGDVLLLPLVADQVYEVSVQLTVPHSDSNVALGTIDCYSPKLHNPHFVYNHLCGRTSLTLASPGNFMTYLTILNPSNKTLTSSSTPSLLLPLPQPPFYSDSTNMKGRLSQQNMKILYNACVLPALSYTAPVWWNGKKQQI